VVVSLALLAAPASSAEGLIPLSDVQMDSIYAGAMCEYCHWGAKECDQPLQVACAERMNLAGGWDCVAPGAICELSSCIRSKKICHEATWDVFCMDTWKYCAADQHRYYLYRCYDAGVPGTLYNHCECGDIPEEYDCAGTLDWCYD